MAQGSKKTVIAVLAALQLALAGAIAWFLLATPSAPGNGEEIFGSEDIEDARPQKLPTSHVVINGRKIVVEVARTDAQRAKGLMFRKSLPEHHGMIFLFEEPRRTQFWNRNVPIDLDLAFADADGVIVHLDFMKARDERGKGPKKESFFIVLEMPGGYFGKNGVKVGDRMELPEDLKPMRRTDE